MMRIGFLFYGITYGLGTKIKSNRDYKHCWPNLKRMIIDPFVEQGHTAKILISTYHFEDKNIEKEFFSIVKPDAIVYSDKEGSDPFTAKYASFQLLNQIKDIDIVVFTRIDAHWSKVIARDRIDPNKFNFLFREKGWWNNQYNFTCDNFYIWPYHMTPAVEKAMGETYAWPRGKPMVDTHALISKLVSYIPITEMNLISEIMETSDVNSYYTCCRSGLPEDGRGGMIHPEVKERFGYK